MTRTHLVMNVYAVQSCKNSKNRAVGGHLVNRLRPLKVSCGALSAAGMSALAGMKFPFEADMTDKHRLNLHVDRDLLRRYKAACAANNVSMSDLVRLHMQQVASSYERGQIQPGNYERTIRTDGTIEEFNK